MKFFYDSRTDILGVRFKPGKAEAAAHRQEVMPGVAMEFDKRNHLAYIEIRQASQHQPELGGFIQELAQELVRSTPELSKEALLAIEKTLRLGQDPVQAESPEYNPCLSFDAVANVLVVEFLRPAAGAELMPKKQIIDGIWAVFDAQGYLVLMELHAALQHFPDLQRFVAQAQELQALQHFFRPGPPRK